MDPINGKIYYEIADVIYWADLDGQNAAAWLSEDANDLAVDPTGGKVYWSDDANDRIRRANLDASGVETLASIPSPQGIDLDLTNNHIYLGTAGGTEGIHRYNLDGSGYLLIESVPANYTIRGVVASPSRSQVYFTNAGTGKNVLVTGYTGSGVTQLFAESNPWGIDIDEAGGVLYWSDKGNPGTIKRGPVSGGDGNEESLFTVTQSNHLELISTATLTVEDETATLVANAGSFAFQSSFVGTTDGETFTIRETAGVTASVSSVVLGGSHPGDFSLGSVPSSISSSGSAPQLVQFAPTASGARSATLTISSDASPSPYTISLSGLGLLPSDYGDADGASYLTSGAGAAAHEVGGPHLGSLAPDAETDGQRVDGTATGDDAGGTDDEDGVSFPNPVLVFDGASHTASVEIETYGAGFLSVWIDLNLDGAFTDEASASGEEVLSDEAVGTAGTLLTTTYNLSIPASSNTGITYVRARFCSTVDSCDTPGGTATDGEVEDYQLSVLDGDDIPIAGGSSASVDGTDIVVTFADGTSASFPIASLSGSTLVLTGSSTGDSVTLSPSLLATAGLTVNVNLGDGFDTLTFPPATSGDVTHIFDNATDGSIQVAGGATVNYTGLDPIIDNLDAANRVFTFSGAPETIELTPDGDGSTGNGYSFIDSDFAESVLFKNPTTSLTINTGGGADTVVLGEMDGPVGAGFTGIVVNGGDGAGTDADADAFQVTPSTEYPIFVNGENARGTCPVDALVLNLAGGAVVDTQSPPTSGTITFSSGHETITFTDIEAIGDADVELTLSTGTIYATDILSGTNALVVTATNNGPDAASCVTVNLDPVLSSYLLDVTASGDGSFVDPVWDIGPLASGATATLTLEGYVTTPVDQTASFEAEVAEDLDTDNNTASLAVSLGFLFPAKAHVNTAGYITKTITVAGETYTYDQLILGLYQGSPGIDGAVWCQLPDEISNATPSSVWPPAPLTPAAMGSLLRPCATGLPFPLHPNDFLEDAAGNLWLAVWGSAGLYKSEDQGQTWQEAWPRLGPGSASDGIYWTNVYAITQDAAGILYISANNGQVYRTLDGGDNWQLVGSLPEGSADTPWSLTAHPTVPGTLYAGLFGKGVYISEDFGLTWDVFGGTAENDVLLGTASPVDAQNPNSLNAGYVYDLAFAPDAPEFLFAATSRGVWRADLDGADPSVIDAPGWELVGPVVTLDAVPAVTCTLFSTDPACVIPEVRHLAFDESATPDALLATTWGFGAYQNTAPTGAGTFSEIALKASHITFVAVSPSGEITVGGLDGSVETVTLAASGSTSTAAEPSATQEVPDGYTLSQNYPNPFNPVTTIGFALPETGRVRLAVYDGLGREVAVLVDGVQEAGRHAVSFDAQNLPTGAYLYRLTTDEGAIARTLVLMK